MKKKCPFLTATKDIHHLSPESEIRSASANCKPYNAYQDMNQLKTKCLSPTDNWTTCLNYQNQVNK